MPVTREVIDWHIKSTVDLISWWRENFAKQTNEIKKERQKKNTFAQETNK
jgi:hypothetical protein